LPAPIYPAESDRGAKLLLQTKSRLEKNSSLLKSRPVFSDCSISEGFNCLEARVGSDSDFIIAEKLVQDFWDQQGWLASPDPARNSPSTETLIAVRDKKKWAEFRLVIPSSDRSAKPEYPSANGRKAKIAIVMDDLGSSYEDALPLAQIPAAIAFSILPFQTYSADILRLAEFYHKQPLLHMPMQPVDYPATNPGKNALLISMTQEQIKASVQSALQSLPGVIGVNNHMGSLFTTRPELMRPVLEQIYQQGLFFLDSRTSKDDISYTLAREMGVKACERGLFLDNLRDEDAIARKLVELCENARNGKSGIAIAHPYPETINVLAEKLVRLSQMGCEVVSIQEFCQ